MAAREAVINIPELLGNIFSCSLENSSYARPGRLDESPTVFTRVSKSWKLLTENTPQLWASMDLESKTGDIRELEYHLRVLTVWLDRSKSCPLRMRLSYKSQESEESVDSDEGIESNEGIDLMGRIVALITLHASRWQLLDVSFLACFVGPIVRSIGSATPILKNLVVEAIATCGVEFAFGERVAYEDDDSLTVAFENAAQLEIFSFRTTEATILPCNLVVENLPESLRAFDVTLGYNGILQLGCRSSLREFGYSGCMDMEVLVKSLSALPRLEKLDLSFIDIFIFDDQAEPIVLPLLREFILRVKDASPVDAKNMCGALDLFTLPALEAFEAIGDWTGKSDTDDPWRHFPSFLFRSRPPLKSLKIHIWEMSYTDCLPILILLPGLEHLTLPMGGYGEDIGCSYKTSIARARIT